MLAIPLLLPGDPDELGAIYNAVTKGFSTRPDYAGVHDDEKRYTARLARGQPQDTVGHPSVGHGQRSPSWPAWTKF